MWTMGRPPPVERRGALRTMRTRMETAKQTITMDGELSRVDVQVRLQPTHFFNGSLNSITLTLTEPNQSSSSQSQSTSQQKSSSSSAEQSKRQRQNAAKREAQKVAKASAEADRLATLAKHKRELERAKMVEQFAGGGGGKGGKTSGGMTASVDANGKLVWE